MDGRQSAVIAGPAAKLHPNIRLREPPHNSVRWTVCRRVLCTPHWPLRIAYYISLSKEKNFQMTAFLSEDLIPF